MIENMYKENTANFPRIKTHTFLSTIQTHTNTAVL